MRLRLILFALIAVSVFSAAKSYPAQGGYGVSQIGPAQPSSALDQELIAQVKQFDQAAKSKDIQYFKRTLTDDFLEIGNNGASSDKADFIKDKQEPEKPEAPARKSVVGEQERLYDFQVLPLNEGAAVVSYNKIDPGQTPKYLHISTVWVKQDGQWKLKFEQITPNLWSLNDI
jgi:hypothetical protein